MSWNASRETEHDQSVVDRTNLDENSIHPEDEDMDIPEILEDIIEILLSGLRDTVCLKGRSLYGLEYFLIYNLAASTLKIRFIF